MFAAAARKQTKRHKNPTTDTIVGFSKKKNMKLSLLKSNTGQVEGLPKNPRFIRDEKFKKLVKSVESFPEMMKLRPIVYIKHNKSNVVIGGNMRLRALQELGFKEIPDEWVKDATDLTAEKRKEFVIKDNASFGSDDWD